MVTNTKLNNYLAQLLQINSFNDYCPNGLQIEGTPQINKIVTGVSANLAFIKQAINNNADAILVHHGFFWKNEDRTITHNRYTRIKEIIKNNLNLFAYHLPLDAHHTLGNNYRLAKLLQIQKPKVINDSLIWQGIVNMPTTDFIKIITNKLARQPQVFGDISFIKNIAFCTGAAQNFITDIIKIKDLHNIDAYLSGEVSESTPAAANENKLLYIGAGHHATERGGVIALGEHLAHKFNIIHQFIDVVNSV